MEKVARAFVLVAVDGFHRLHMLIFGDWLVAMRAKFLKLVRHERSLHLKVNILDVLIVFTG